MKIFDTEYQCHQWQRIFVITITFFPDSWLITWFIRVIRQVQEMLTLTEQLCSISVFSGTQASCCPIFSFMYNVLKIIVCAFLFCLSLDHCTVYPSSMYDFVSDYPFGSSQYSVVKIRKVHLMYIYVNYGTYQTKQRYLDS